MKTWMISAVAGWLVAAGSVRADLTIVQKIEGMGQTMESTAKFKGSKTRVDSASSTVIMDLASGEMVQLTGPQKTYMKLPAQLTRAAIDDMKKARDATSEKPQLVPSGKKETISGFEAAEYTCNLAGAHLALWLTKALPDYEKTLREMSAAFSKGPVAAMMQSNGLDLGSLPGFPIRTVNELQPGQSMTTTVLSVNTQPVADSEFEVPAGYKEITLPSLTQPAPGDAAPTPGR